MILREIFKQMSRNKVMRKVLNIFIGPPSLTEKRALEDYQKAALLCKCYDWYLSRASSSSPSSSLSSLYTDDNIKPNQEDVDKFCSEVDELTEKSLYTVRDYVQKSLHDQVTVMFNNIDKHNDSVEKALVSRTRSGNNNKGNNKLSLLSTVGFELESRQSNIPNSGNGVFIKQGNVIPGTVLAFVPGYVHLTEYASKRQYLDTLLPDNEQMLMGRYDGIVIDSRQANQVPHNPYALAHLVNHVPLNIDKNSKPNVLQLAFDFQSDPLDISDFFPHELRKYIPNKYAKPPTFLGTFDRSACMQTVVLLAAKHLKEGEELYMDYRLRIDNASPDQIPSWYRKWGLEE